MRARSLCTQRPAAILLSAMACAGFARGDLMELLSELLPALDLARLCAASTRQRRHVADVACAALQSQHGLALRDASLAEMHSLDCLPEALNFDLREQGTRRVLRGNPLCTTYVGSYTDRVTLAQIPPASGNAWSIDCSLRRGAYLMTLEGWQNPAHGILDVFLDGRHSGSMDWFNGHTRERSRSIAIDVRWSGPHQLVGRCNRSNADEARPTRHWICLSGVHLHRIGDT